MGNTFSKKNMSLLDSYSYNAGARDNIACEGISSTRSINRLDSTSIKDITSNEFASSSISIKGSYQTEHSFDDSYEEAKDFLLSKLSRKEEPICSQSNLAPIFEDCS